VKLEPPSYLKCTRQKVWMRITWKERNIISGVRLEQLKTTSTNSPLPLMPTPEKPAARQPYNPYKFAEIVVRNYESGRKVMCTGEDWYFLAKALLEAKAIMEQNNYVAVSSQSL
jgi:hypothetical protein